MNLDQLKSKLIERKPKLEKKLNSKEYNNGRIVFKRRMELGLTQQELAILAGVTQKTVSRIEGADSGIRPSTLKKVFKALDDEEFKIQEEEPEALYV